MGIIEHAEQTQEGRDLRRLKQVLSPLRRNRDPRRLQGFRIDGDGISGTEQDRNITRLYRSSLLPNRRTGIKHRNDPASDPERFPLVFRLLLVQILELQHMELHPGTLCIRITGASRYQPFLLPVGHAAHVLGHHRFKGMVDRLQDLRPGSEVPGEEQPPWLRRYCPLTGGECPVLLQKQIRLRLAEAIYGLLHVAHKEPVGIALFGDRGKNRLLHTVGILILIHHDLLKLLRNLSGHVGRRSRSLPDKQTDGKMLLIRKVQPVLPALFGGKPLIQALHQTDKRIERGSKGVLLLPKSL